MSIHKMLFNVAVEIEDAKYLDVMPPGQYGSQFRLKGTVDGDTDGVLYVPGKVWSVRKALVNAGVISADDFDEEPEKAVNVPLLKTSFTLVNKQVPGKPYGNLEVLTVGGDTHANGKPPVQSAPKHSGNIGGPLPGEYDDDNFDPSEFGEPPNAPVATVARPAVAAALAPNNHASKMQQVEAQYLSALTFVLDKVIPRLAKADIPVDGSATNAICATLIIQASK